MYIIEFYKDKNGKSEVYNYICYLQEHKTKENTKKYKKIYVYLELLKEKGVALREPYVKKIDREIWELRPMQDRILFASVQNNILVLLRVFEKNTQKTPRREIIKAKKFLKEYKERGGKDAYLG